ncbi:hypothetical protein F4678DRAFT_480092 [Xylaria arbuscula]|nr:hypothetical protein F4678DRAFT_480092 [Xylaria arbuscula]
MVRKFRTGMNRTNVLETADGTVRIRERWPRKDKYKGPPDLPEDFPYSLRVERCLDALQVLQFKRDEYLPPTTLAVPLQFLHDSLPYMVQRDVNIFQPVQNDLWGLKFDAELPKIDKTEVEEFIEKHGETFVSRRYQFWPIDISRGDGSQLPHWGLIVLQLLHRSGYEDEPVVPDDPETQPYNFVESFAIIDPEHGVAARELEDELTSFLHWLVPQMGVIMDDKTAREDAWVPPSAIACLPPILNAPQITKGITGGDNWSSGLRVFEMVRIFLDRITEHYCHSPHTHEPSFFWAPHSGWFNPDAVRSNMIGCAATMVNRAMNSTTRIAIEPILESALRYRNGYSVKTQTMLPNRETVGAFVPSQPRQNPTWLEDTPNSESGDGDADSDVKAEDSEQEDEEEEAEEEEEEEEEGLKAKKGTNAKGKKGGKKGGNDKGAGNKRTPPSPGTPKTPKAKRIRKE